MINFKIAALTEAIIFCDPSKTIPFVKEIKEETFSFADLSPSNVRAFWKALKVENASQEVKEVLQKIYRLYLKALCPPDVVIRHLKESLTDDDLSSSLLSEWNDSFEKIKGAASPAMLGNLLGRDWAGDRKGLKKEGRWWGESRFWTLYFLEQLYRNAASHTLKVALVQNKLTQFFTFCDHFDSSKEHPLSCMERVQRLFVEIEQMEEGGTLYFPVSQPMKRSEGYVAASQISVLNLTKTSQSYNLRLLSPEFYDWQDRDLDENRFYPEIQWSGVTLDQIKNEKLWQSLMEPDILDVWCGQKEIEAPTYCFKQFGMLISRLINQNVDSYSYDKLNRYLEKLEFKQFPIYGCVNLTDCIKKAVHEEPCPSKTLHQLVTFPKKSGDLPKIKHRGLTELSGKAPDLIALNIFGKSRLNDYKLYKIEKNLLLLAYILHRLTKKQYAPEDQRDFLEIAEKGQRKLIEAMAKLSEKGVDLKRLLATFLDWQTRFFILKSRLDSARLPPSATLYPRPIFPHVVDLSTLIDQMEVDATPLIMESLENCLPPLPTRVMTLLDQANLTRLNHYLKQSLAAAGAYHFTHRSEEWLMFVHEYIFKQLPIPSLDHPSWKLAKDVDLSEVIELMGYLYECANILLKHTCDHEQVLPWHIVGAAKVYRIQLELMLQLVPEAKGLTFSWAHLYKIMNHRGFDQLPGELKKTFDKLRNSFEALSPLGNEIAPVGKDKILPVFDYTWRSVKKEEFPVEKVQEGWLWKHLSDKYRDPGHTFHFTREVMRLFDFLSLSYSEYDDGDIKEFSKIPSAAFILTKQSAQLFQHLLCDEPRSQEESRSLFLSNGPEDKYGLDPSYVWIQSDEIKVYPRGYCGWDINYHERMHQVMVSAKHKVKQVDESSHYYPFLKALSEMEVAENKSQGELLKKVFKSKNSQMDYELSAITQGSSQTILDNLVSYFETRTSELYKEEGRIFFSAVMASARLFYDHSEMEPYFLVRFLKLMKRCLSQDIDHLPDPAYQQRILWIAENYYYAVEVIKSVNKGPYCSKYLKETREILDVCLEKLLTEGSPKIRGKAAMHTLVLSFEADSLARYAKIRFLFGRLQNAEANDSHLRMMAMQNAYQQGHELCKALQAKKQDILDAIFPNEGHLLSELKEIKHESSELSEWICKERKLRREINFLNTYAGWWAKHWGDGNQSWRIKGMRHYKSHLKKELSQAKQKILELKKQITKVQNGAKFHFPLVTYFLEGRTIQLDLVRGLIWENGHSNIIGALPPEISSSEELIPLKKIPALSMKYDDKKMRYTPSHKYFQKLSFNACPPRAYFEWNDEEYKMLIAGEKKELKLPSTLEMGFTAWIGINKQILLCSHDNVGAPLPQMTIDNKGHIHPLNGDQTLVLARERVYPEARIFKRLAVSNKEVLPWMDNSSKIVRIDLPIDFGNNPALTFLRDNNGRWTLEGTDLMLEPFDHSQQDLLGEPFYLLLKNGQGNQFVLLCQDPIEKLRKRYYKGEARELWCDVLAGRAKSKASLYEYDSKVGMRSKRAADNLYLAYLHLMSANYVQSTEILKEWIRPIGRPYTYQEILFIRAIISSNDEKVDDFVDAAAIRLFTIYHFIMHLKEYPIDEEGCNKVLLKFCNSFFKEAKNKSRIKREQLVEDNYKVVMYGTQPHQKCSLDHLLKPYEEEELLRLMRISSYSQIFITVSNRVIKRLYPDREFKKELATNGDLFEKAYRDKDFYKHRFYPFAAEEMLKDKPIDRLMEDLFSFHTLHLPPFRIFPRAYDLICRKDALDEEEKKEYLLLKQYMQDYPKRAKETFSDYTLFENHFLTNPNWKNYIGWQLLIRLDQKKGPFPALPQRDQSQYLSSISKETTKDVKRFLKKLKGLLGIEKWEDLVKDYNDLMSKARLQFVVSKWLPKLYSQDYCDSLQSEIPPSIQKTIDRWKTCKEPAKDLPKIEVPVSILGDVCEKQLLAEANRLPLDENQKLGFTLRQMGSRPALTVDECIGLSLLGTVEAWKKRCPHSDSQKLQELCIQYLKVQTEKQYEQRVLQKKQKPAERCYKGSSEDIALLAHEYYANQRLRKEQVELIRLFLSPQSSDKIDGRAVQLIMGAGKTTVLAPILALYLSSGHHISLFCVPNALFGTIKDDFLQMMRDRFRRKVDVLTFKRDDCSVQRLVILVEKMMRAEQDGTILITRPKDLHALQLMLKERHELIYELEESFSNTLLQWLELNMSANQAKEALSLFKEGKDVSQLAQKKKDKFKKQIHWWKKSLGTSQKVIDDYRKESDILQSILNALGTLGRLQIDEFAAVNDPRNQLSFPLGSQKTANPESYHVACSLYFDWLAQIEKHVRLETNEQTYVTQDKFAEVQIFLVQQAWGYFKKDLKEVVSEKVFADYVLQRPSTSEVKTFYTVLTKWNQSRSIVYRSLSQQIGFLKYVLSIGLKGAFEASLNVNYGRSREAPDFKLSIPYECGDTPKENTLFKKAWETLLKTVQYYRQIWDDPEMTLELIAYCQSEVLENPNSSMKQSLLAVFGPDILKTHEDFYPKRKELTKRLSAALKDERKKQAALPLIDYYLRTAVLPRQLKIDPLQITSNPQDLTQITKTTDGFGGTWSYHRTWPLNIERHPRKETDEKIEKALLKKENSRCLVIDSKSVLKQLKTLIHSKTSAIIDVGALMSGISNRKLAEELFKMFPKRKGILYYDRRKNSSVTELALMTVKGSEFIGGTDWDLIKEKLRAHNVHNPLTIYDHAHFIGANIPQAENSEALVLISDRATLDDIYQAVMRMRMLLKGEQCVSFVIPKAMECEDKWTVRKILQNAKRIQDEREAKANYHGICDQLRGVVRHYIDHKMRTEPDYQQRENFYRRVRSFMLEEQNNDLFQEFGGLRARKKPFASFRDLMKKLPLELIESDVQKRGKLYQELKKILKHHKSVKTKLPKMIWEGEYFAEATQEVDIAKDKQMMQEEENERMLAGKIPLKERPWKVLKLEKVKPLPFGQFRYYLMPALYTLNDALADRKLPSLFDNNLLISHNMVATFKGQTNSLVTSDQKPVTHLLVTLHRDRLQAVILSEQDSASLKEILHRNPVKDCWIVEPNGALIKNGHCKTPWSDPFTTLFLELKHDQLKSLLIQSLIFQGDVHHLVRDYKKYEKPLSSWLASKGKDRKQVRNLFEEILTYRQDDARLFGQNWHLRKLFS